MLKCRIEQKFCCKNSGLGAETADNDVFIEVVRVCGFVHGALLEFIIHDCRKSTGQHCKYTHLKHQKHQKYQLTT